MPALDPEAYAEFSRMVDELEPEIDNMKDVPRGFMADMVEKKKLYGERMFVSPKQKDWVEKLHGEFVGDTATKANTRDDRDPRSDRDMDDDIPF